MKHLIVAGALALAAASPAAVVYDETTDGDLSDDFLVPTPITFGPGPNTLVASLSGGSLDVDLFTFTISPGQELTEFRVPSFTGGGMGSFLGIQPGATLSQPPSSSFSDPIGNLLISRFLAEDGGNFLPQLVLVPGLFGPGLVSTLGPGDYTVWLNETGPSSRFSIEFTVVPEPSSALLLLPCLAAFALHRRK